MKLCNSNDRGIMVDWLVSVIVPVYNVEKYLNRCIESLLNQTYSNIEVVLVDDGSTDGCGIICDRWGKEDSRIRVFHQQNKGLSVARNVGMTHANGDFFIFVDSDDFIHPQMIERMIKVQQKHSAEIVVCAKCAIEEDCLDEASLKEMWEDEQKQSVFVEDERICSGKNVLEELYKEDSIDFIIAWNKLFSRKFLSVLKFPEGRTHEDEFVIPKILFLAEKIVYYKKPMYYYIRRAGSITRAGSVKSEVDLVDALLDRLVFFEKNGLTQYMERGVKHAIMQGLCGLERIKARDEKEAKKLCKKVYGCYCKYNACLKFIDKIRYAKRIILR